MTQRECTYNELRLEMFLRQREEGCIVWRTKAAQKYENDDKATHLELTTKDLSEVCAIDNIRVFSIQMQDLIEDYELL